MPATHQRDFLYMLSVLFVFIEFNILLYIMTDRQIRTHLNAGSPQPQPASRRRRKPPNPWVTPWILQRPEEGCYSNLLADLIHTDIPGYHNFVRMPPAFLYLIEEHIHQGIKKSVTNFRNPLKVGLKLVIMLRHLATRDLHLLAVSLAGQPNHHLQIRPRGLPSHPC